MSRSSAWQYVGLAVAALATIAIVILAVSRVGAPTDSGWTPPDSARDASPVNTVGL